MQANSLHIRCVNQCLLDCIQDGTLTLNLKKSSLDRTKDTLSKLWSFLIFNKLVRNVTLKAMLQLVDKKIDCFSVDGFCNHCNTRFEAMGCYLH